MSLAHRYQKFGSFQSVEPAAETLSNEFLEDQKLESFEAGYQAGWDDAVKAQADDKTRVSAEFAQNLQEMSFTYHEALTRLTIGMQPLMQQIVNKLLPTTAREVLGSHILDLLSDMIRDQADQPIEISVAPENSPMVEALAQGALTRPFILHPDPSLGSGQAFVRVGGVEKEVDLDAIVAGISNGMAAVFGNHKSGA